LQLFVLPKVAMSPDGLHFVLRFSIDKVRWGSHKVGTVGTCFDIWGKKVVMEDRVDVPRHGEIQLRGDWGDEFRDGEWAISFWGEFDCAVGDGKVLSF
jgi:hypothetical protein